MTVPLLRCHPGASGCRQDVRHLAEQRQLRRVPAAQGVEPFLAQLQGELQARTYRPLRNRKVEIPKDGGKVRVLGIPAIRDRVVQGALKLILEPIFEAGFHDGSYGYRPKRTAHQAIARVAYYYSGFFGKQTKWPHVP